MDFAEIIAVLSTLTGEPVDAERHFGAIATGGHDGDAPVAITACPQPMSIDEIEGETMICGTVSVPENHVAPDGKRIDLFFAVLKSHSEVPEPDALVYLHGGPGMGNMNGLAGLAQFFDGWRQTRDIVTFDQRAAGLSTGEAACQGVINTKVGEVVRGELSGELVGPCIEELKNSDITLQYYNTRQNALDVPMVVGTLGFDSYNILGISYGTKLTLEVMRAAPEGLRSVILDGVAPMWLPLYETLAVPINDSMVRLVEDCAADPICDDAYPNLGDILTETLDAATAGELVHPNGTAFGPEVILDMFAQRADGHHLGNPTITPFMPAMVYEFHRMIEDPAVATPTLDYVIENGYVLPSDPVSDLRQTAQVTDVEGERLLELAISQAERIRETDHELDVTLKGLREAVTRQRDYTPLAGLLDRELALASGTILADSALLVEFATDVATFISGHPTREALTAFIAGHFEGPAAARLLALANAMSEEEIASFFEASGRSLLTATYDFMTTTDLWIYACQEDVPFNTLQGYEATTASLDYPQTDAYWGSQAGLLLDTVCPMFDQYPREGWQEVVQSDIPTLSLGSTWDIQTSQNWAITATEGLTNAQAFIIPEAGHGAILYSQCALDMAESFVNDPSRQFAEGTCTTDVLLPFHIADWVQEAAAISTEEAAAPVADDSEPTAETEVAALSPSFDCTAARSDAEQLICADADLAMLDLRLADRFAEAIAVAEGLDAGAKEAASTLRAYQRGWVSGRDECWKSGDLRACVEDAYLRREGQLVAEWMLEEPTEVTSYACDGNPANEVTVFYFGTERPSARLEYGDSVDTATVVPSEIGTRYEGTFGHSLTLEGDTATLVWSEGTEMTCVPAR
ncbi:alpha/beta fold hydrolase [Lutimaribacter marinistellae]|uniref:Alpha/beta fold hydrolase n=1 Tax=Lutimaribacter marinistellae TaxID=1820329 RepID=A0ABV7TMA2_9RHOB